MASFTSDGHYRFHHPGGIQSLNPSNHTHPPPMDPFRAHLVALLSIYELGPFPGTPIPRYEGPTDWQTESILKSFGAVARRMCSAEETVSAQTTGDYPLIFFLYIIYTSIIQRTVKRLSRNHLLNKVLKRSLLLKKKIPRFHGSMGRTWQSLSMVCNRLLILPLYFLALTGIWKLIRLRSIAVATVCFSFVYNVPYCCQLTFFGGGRRLPSLLEIWRRKSLVYPSLEKCWVWSIPSMI